LGQLYLEQERFTDSAETYQKFVENNPTSNFAPDFSIRTINVYEQGGFPSLIRPAKQEFVERYGIRSDFWTQREGTIGTNALQFLHQSLQELAKYEHAEAQRLKTANERREATAAYAKAAAWYREFVQTFPQDTQAAAMTFLLAEALYEAGDLVQALSAYEKVAYSYRDPVNGAEAGYSAILLAQELIDSAQPSMGEPLQNWQLRKIDNALRFAREFSSDARAVSVLAQAAPELLKLERYNDAIGVAERVIAWQPVPEGALASA
jgi:tetratricopeptide (TPR) repeat protein